MTSKDDSLVHLVARPTLLQQFSPTDMCLHVAIWQSSQLLSRQLASQVAMGDEMPSRAVASMARQMVLPEDYNVNSQELIRKRFIACS